MKRKSALIFILSLICMMTIFFGLTGCDDYNNVSNAESETLSQTDSVESADGHKHDFQSIVTVPTCTEQGFTTLICDCGETYQGNFVDALGHDYGDPIWAWNGYNTATATFICKNDNKHVEIVYAEITTDSSVPVTCTEDGQNDYTATAEFNGNTYTDKKTEIIESVGHDFQSVVTAPTCTERGYTTYTCSVCGFVEIGDYVEAGHSYNSAYLFDEKYHWHEVTCEHSDAIVKVEHTFDENGYCICGYNKSTTALVYKKIDGKEEYAVDEFTDDTLTSVYIPETYNGLPVTEINEIVFYENTAIKTVVMGDSIRKIGNSCFNGCTNMENIRLSANLTAINDYTFYNCSSLKSVVIPDGVTSIGDDAFYNCSGLTSITIGNGVTSIGDNAFWGCSGLTSMIIPDSVTSIGNYAFGWCRGLTSITIGNGVTSIGMGAFSGCSGLTSVTIPDSVTKIGSEAFSDCTGLASISISDNVTMIGAGAFYKCPCVKTSKGLSYVDKWVIGCNTTITKADIKEDTIGIGDGAFSDCSGLTSVIIPDSVTSIGNWAFSGCSGLTSITIGNGVTSIGDSAFLECVNIENISCPTMAILSIPKDNLRTIIITGGESIGDNAFYNCRGLTSVTIPDSVTSIGDNAFSGCSGLTSVTISGGVKNIGDSAFSNCSGLTSVTIPDSVTSIGNSAFINCSGLTSVTIPDSVTSIGDGAFSGCNSLKYNEYENGYYLGNKDNPYVVLIKAKYQYITSCKINDNTKIIYGNAFYNCSGLTSVIIPDSVTEIGYRAFYNCSGLTSITIPDSVTSIGDNAFSDCNSLKYNEYDNGYYLGNKDNPYVVLIKAKYQYITSCKINDNTKIIYGNAFYNCSGLTSVIIPDSVTSIGSYAFSGCSGLTSVIIPDSVTSIGSYAFSGWSGLTSITIPDSVTSIGDYAFCNCSGLASVIIPDSVTEIGSKAFGWCDNLKKVTFLSEVPPTIGSDLFGGTWDASDFVIYVPSSGLEAYKAITAEYWQVSAVSHIVAIPEN